MIYEPALLDRLEQLGSDEWEGVVWRHMFGSYPPSRQNTGGARWNPRGTSAIYTSLNRHQITVIRPRQGCGAAVEPEALGHALGVGAGIQLSERCREPRNRYGWLR